MKESDLLGHLLQRLCRDPSSGAVFSGDEAAHWPESRLEILVDSGFLQRAEPAKLIECDGCELICLMPVVVRSAEGNWSAQAFISCDRREDVGRVPVGLERLAQWQITGAMLASVTARLLGFSKAPREEVEGKRWTLGRLKGRERNGEVKLLLEGSAMLTIANQSIQLVDILTISGRTLEVDSDILFRLLDRDVLEPASGMGSPEWRKQTAKAAADALHDRAGGSRDKQRQIRELWATGKYSSRDICAEEECAALGMSFSAARKALRNTPEPVQGIG